MHEDDFTFNGQRKGEKVLRVVRNHPIILTLPIIKTLFFLALGILTLIQWPGEYSGLVLIVCVLAACGVFSRSYYDYSQSVFLITNDRVINVDQEGFWARKITETDLDKIQSATSQTSGIWRVMFKFGNLIIHTAGTSREEEIVVKNIPNPYEVQQSIGKIR